MIASLVNRWKTTHRRNTAHGYRQILRRFLQFVDKLHGTHHSEDTPRVPAKTARQTICSDEDFDRIMKASPTWFRFFLMCCRYQGLRNNEASTLTPEHFTKDTTTGEGTINFDRKMNGTSNLPVHPEIASFIEFTAKVSTTEPVIKTLGARSSKQAAINRAWLSALQDSGVNPNITIHDLRRTAARKLMDRTKDIRLVQQLLGHRHLSSTLYYLGEADPESLRQHLTAIAPVSPLHAMKPATEVKQ
jgi:integrase